MKKKLTIFMILIATLASSLPAATWQFSSSYPEVTHFRFQFNTDKKDNWIKVGANDTIQSFNVPDGTTLYVQQSLDNGKTWSRSASATYHKAPTREEVKEKEAEGLKKVDVPVKVVKEEATRRPFSFGIGIRFPELGFAFPESGSTKFSADQGLGLQFRFSNVASSSPRLGMHIMWNIDALALSKAAEGFPKDLLKDTQKSISTDVILAFSALLSDGRGDLWFGFGPGVDFVFNDDVLSPCWLLTPPGKAVVPPKWMDSENFTVGATLFAAAELGFDWHFSDHYSVGLEYRFKYSFESFEDWGHNRMGNMFTVQNTFSF